MHPTNAPDPMIGSRAIILRFRIFLLLPHNVGIWTANRAATIVTYETLKAIQHLQNTPGLTSIQYKLLIKQKLTLLEGIPPRRYGYLALAAAGPTRCFGWPG